MKISKDDWTTIVGFLLLLFALALIILGSWHIQDKEEIKRLESEVAYMDTLLMSCRADRDSLAYAVIRGFESIFDALPRPVNYVEAYDE